MFSPIKFAVAHQRPARNADSPPLRFDRLAEAVVHRFLDDVVEQLRRELPEKP